jgi:Fe-S-cluster containining protein
VTCTRCGDCCRYIMLPLTIDSDGYYEWLRLHGATIVQLPVTETASLTCARFELACDALLTDGSCGIYAERPAMCAMWRCEKEGT